MKLQLRVPALFLLLGALPAAQTAAPEAAAKPGAQPRASPHWPSFRGERASGVAEGYATATTWDVASGKGVAWKTAIPGLAHSSPVVWGERVFLTSAVRKAGEAELKVGLYGDIAPVADEGEHLFQVLALDKQSGKILWCETAFDGQPRYPRHTKGSFAASTPATDGERVVACFGTEGLYAYDLDGKLLWKKDLGDLDSGFYMVPSASWGFSSSPVIHEDLVLVQCDVQKGSYVTALSVTDGKEVWRVARDELPTWSTPTVDVREGRAQVICNGYKHIGAYDLRTGAELWKLKGGGDIPVPTPIVAHDLVFITNAHGQAAPILAIDANAKGTLSMNPEESEFTAWSDLRKGNYMQTPLVYGEFLYCCNDAGILTCFDAGTGEEVYRERLGSGRSGFTSSGVAADGKLYFTSEEGEVHVVAEGYEFEQLATNALGEEHMASPAISEGMLLFRTRGHLVAIAPPE
jgi:outer membrane protein assembly factor BamB